MLGLVGNSNASSSSSPPPRDSINGLKFGRKIYFENAGAVTIVNAAPPPPKSSFGAPGRKGHHGGGHQQQPPRCQVEGCRVHLSDAKAYYSRHKVCGIHSKSPIVIVAGLQQRFCQQCSRFHQLPEFDLEKRSCADTWLATMSEGGSHHQDQCCHLVMADSLQQFLITATELEVSLWTSVLTQGILGETRGQMQGCLHVNPVINPQSQEEGLFVQPLPARFFKWD